MPRIDRKTPAAARRTSPLVESLEGRSMLNATPIPAHHAPAPAHLAKSNEHAAAAHLAAAKTAAHAAAIKAAHLASVKAAAVKAAAHAAAIKAAATCAHHAGMLHFSVIRPTKAVQHNRRFLDLIQVGDGSGGDSGDGAQATYAPVLGAYNPTQLQTAYGVNLLGLANQGQGVTIGIIDEYDDTAILNDANVYSTQYNLPQFDGLNGDPVLSVVKDTAFGAVPSAVGTGVAAETSLDVEMAHALAPKANILLVEVPADNNFYTAFAELLHGGQLAAGSSVNGAPVVSVSTSYGYPEGSIGNVATLDSTYLSTGASTNVAMTFSTGDYSTPLFPATSPNVIGVGGTALYLASARGRYSNEIAWGGLSGAGAGGGGLSSTFSTPAYQSGNGVAFANRAIPDISMNADVLTAVSVYDSLDVTAKAPDPWVAYGGTSEASPLFAAVLALTQQRRLAANLPILNSVQVNTAIYGLYNSASYPTYFHDITQGNNTDNTGRARTTITGYNAGVGYDLATGIGSPIVNALVPYLASL